MKKPIFSLIILALCSGLFSQESILLTDVELVNGIGNINKSGSNASMKSYDPASFEAYIADWATMAYVPGLSICVLKNGELYWVHHYGLANIAGNIPVNDYSVFYLASISKTVVETASMQLWEQDTFELNDTVSDYLQFPVINPYYPDIPITFYQLMTHTSSISNYYPNAGGVPFNQYIPGYFPAGGAYYSQNNYLNASPGSQYLYSNIAASLLGYLTHKMAQQDYSEYCEEHIFQPLGISNGSYYLAKINPSNLVTQYNTASNGTHTQNATPDGGGAIYPAAVLKMSAIELSKFLAMYMQHGTFNDSTILSPETIDLITTPTPVVGGYDMGVCLIWHYMGWADITFHDGSTSFSATFMGYDKDDQWGVIILLNTHPPDQSKWLEVTMNLSYFASVFNPFTVASIAVDDADGDQVIEANEEFGLGLTLRNDMNYPDVAGNVTATISVNSPYINLISDSVVSLGTLNYLDEIELADDQFVFQATNDLQRGTVECALRFTWDSGNEYITTFYLYAGHADVLLVRDEESISVDFGSGVSKIQDYYLESLDALEYETYYWDLEVMGDPTPGFISSFPSVIWFTGNDGENTVSESNQALLSGYLDNGGRLFMSGQNISDDLDGSVFLENYLHVEHLEDTINNNYISGLANDPIGNGETYPLNTGDALLNQYSQSVIGPLEGADMVFKYMTTVTKGAAVRFANETYKTVFFAFGFEALAGSINRKEILFRILNDYFGVIVGTEDQLGFSPGAIGLNVWPNPAGQTACIEYSLPADSPVNIKILDLSGREMVTLVNEVQPHGEKQIVFNTAGLKPGIYFCILKTNEGVQTKKMIKL